MLTPPKGGLIMGFIITWDETLNQNPLFIGCQPVNNGFGLRLFHPKGTRGSEPFGKMQAMSHYKAVSSQ